MNTEPTRLQRLVIGAIGLVLTVALGQWLTLSYFGVWTSDAKVSVEVERIGDAIGPGAKVRYHGIIVGRVLRLSDHGDGYRLHLLVNEDHSKSIPANATARILPSTVFGSEYVELLADKDAVGDAHLVSGDVLAADSTEATLSLMKSFDEAERLISAVDAEDINRITGKLAPALDGKGDDIKDFLERTDRVVTDFNRDLPTVWETLTLAAGALDTIADIEPDLTSAMGHSRTTTDTIAEKDRTIGSVLNGSAKVVDRADTLFAGLDDVLLTFVQRLERLTGLAAGNGPAVQQILANFAKTGTNGAAGVDDNAIQMIGTIGLDIPHAYTAADCTRYGPTLIATNCGDPVPAEAPAEPTSEAAGIDGLAAKITAMLEQAESASKGDKPVAGSVATLPETSSETHEPQGLFEILRDLGLLMGRTTP
ncbi:MCE family protein [Aeromicrobium sp.]|uniref:MCE family protein n=1 Tax=Aeromicrobium sp. TaxID=1871063 RepID=UPI002FCC611C